MSNFEQCVEALKQGKIIAYPTEAVFGLGCDPDNAKALEKLLTLKGRDKAKGFILVAANIAQLEEYIDLSALDESIKKEIFATWPGAVTWIMPAGKNCTTWLTGEFDSIAVRVSAHPLVQKLCLTFGKPITSSSANLSGQPPYRTFIDVKTACDLSVDAVLEGETLGNQNPSEIRDARTGKILRQG